MHIKYGGGGKPPVFAACRWCPRGFPLFWKLPKLEDFYYKKTEVWEVKMATRTSESQAHTVRHSLLFFISKRSFSEKSQRGKRVFSLYSPIIAIGFMVFEMMWEAFSGLCDRLLGSSSKPWYDFMSPGWMFMWLHDRSGRNHTQWNDLIRSWQSSRFCSACSEAELLCVLLHSWNLVDGCVSAFSRLPQGRGDDVHC